LSVGKGERRPKKREGNVWLWTRSKGFPTTPQHARTEEGTGGGHGPLELHPGGQGGVSKKSITISSPERRTRPELSFLGG